MCRNINFYVLVIQVFFTVMSGTAIASQTGPCIQAITAARTAAYEIFALIDRVSF